MNGTNDIRYQKRMGLTLALCAVLLLTMLLPGAMIIEVRFGPEAHQVSYREMSYLYRLGLHSLFGSLVAFALNGINILLCLAGISGKQTARWVFGISTLVFLIAAFICITARKYTWMSALPPTLALGVLISVDHAKKI